jgi:hypothetical protein
MFQFFDEPGQVGEVLEKSAVEASRYVLAVVQFWKGVDKSVHRK